MRGAAYLFSYFSGMHFRLVYIGVDKDYYPI